ncbi:MAG: ribbon-helix-helix domain-containing protein [Thermodesulfobacteriota bacterium]
MKGQHVDIWSEQEVVSYLQGLVKKGSVKRCSKLRLEKGYLNAYYPRCIKGCASREEADNVKTSPKGDSAPRQYAWPVCPETCLSFEETADFTRSLLAKPMEERIMEKEPPAIPAVAATIQKREEKKGLTSKKTLKRDGQMAMRVDEHLSEAQIRKLKKLSRKTGLPVSEHIQRAIDEYLSGQETENE